jgi:hypothetical protein
MLANVIGDPPAEIGGAAAQARHVSRWHPAANGECSQNSHQDTQEDTEEDTEEDTHGECLSGRPSHRSRDGRRRFSTEATAFRVEPRVRE